METEHPYRQVKPCKSYILLNSRLVLILDNTEGLSGLLEEDVFRAAYASAPSSRTRKFAASLSLQISFFKIKEPLLLESGFCTADERRRRRMAEWGRKEGRKEGHGAAAPESNETSASKVKGFICRVERKLNFTYCYM